MHTLAKDGRLAVLRAAGTIVAAALVACGTSGGSSPTLDPDASGGPEAGIESDASSGRIGSDAGGGTCETATCSRVQCAALGPDCAPKLDCAPEVLCGRASFLKSGGSISSSTSGGGPEKYDTNGPDTEENARCILEALRDGKVGRVEWGWSGGVASRGEVIDIVAGRRAFGTFSESFDSPIEKGGFSAVPLKPASHFEACLATGDVDAWGKCLASALDPCP